MASLKYREPKFHVVLKVAIRWGSNCTHVQVRRGVSFHKFLTTGRKKCTMIEAPVFLQSGSMRSHFRPVTPPRETDGHTPSLKINDLSMNEREMALQDLHGVSDIPNEDGVFVENALKELRGELDRKDSIAADDQELLQFLRAECFDTLKAAARFNRFSTFQRKLFGKQDKRKYSDLTNEDVKFLESGFMQLLPQRDRAGRAIIMCIGALKQQLKTSIESDVSILLLTKAPSS